MAACTNSPPSSLGLKDCEGRAEAPRDDSISTTRFAAATRKAFDDRSIWHVLYDEAQPPLLVIGARSKIQAVTMHTTLTTMTFAPMCRGSTQPSPIGGIAQRSIVEVRKRLSINIIRAAYGNCFKSSA